jgi:hypothetical protein
VCLRISSQTVGSSGRSASKPRLQVPIGGFSLPEGGLAAALSASPRDQPLETSRRGSAKSSIIDLLPLKSSRSYVSELANTFNSIAPKQLQLAASGCENLNAMADRAPPIPGQMPSSFDNNTCVDFLLCQLAFPN